MDLILIIAIIIAILIPGPCRRQIPIRGFRPFGPGVRIDDRHIRDEAIATLWKSLEKSRILGRVPQCTPKLRDRNINGLVEITETFVGPDPAAQLLPSDDFPRTLQQDL